MWDQYIDTSGRMTSRHSKLSHFYDVLGLRPGATQDDIKRSYYNLVKKYHPDHNRHDSDALLTKLKQVNEAYSEIKRAKLVKNAARKTSNDNRQPARASTKYRTQNTFPSFKAMLENTVEIFWPMAKRVAAKRDTGKR